MTVFVDLFGKSQEVIWQAKQLRELERIEHERKLAEAQQRWEAERQQFAMKMAQAIQQKLFPVAPPTLRGLDIFGMSQPAESTGGDYFDYIPFLNNCLGVVMGDVSGHGIGPALLMAATRAYLRALALTYDDVAEILGMANRALVDDFANQHFVTLMLARLDLNNGSFIYSSAGHPPGYILSDTGDVKQVLKATSFPLGITSDGEFPAATENGLQSDDLVFLYTDGLVETCGPADIQFGVERALKVVQANRNKSAREIVRLVYDTLDSFAQPCARDDDVTLLVIKLVPS